MVPVAVEEVPAWLPSTGVSPLAVTLAAALLPAKVRLLFAELSISAGVVLLGVLDIVVGN